MFYLNEKGKAYREEQHRNKIIHRRYQANIEKRKALGERHKANAPTEEQIKESLKRKREAEYRKQLEKEGYSEDLITTILPTIMNGN